MHGQVRGVFYSIIIISIDAHNVEFVVFDTQCSYYSHCHYRNLIKFKVLFQGFISVRLG